MRFRKETMRTACRWVLSGLVVWAGEAGWAQGADSKPEAHGGADAGVRILREIRDPHTGAHWLVIANSENPAGPGRVVPAGDAGAEPHAVAVVIHKGDRVVVEEHTTTADGYLEATALEPASVGSCFGVRLNIGGRVIRAVALASGRATLFSALVQPGKGRP